VTADQLQDGEPLLVGVGASAGGVEALAQLFGALSADIPAAFFVVLHVSAHGSALPQILSRAGPLRVVSAADGMPVAAGTAYVAPPDRHLLLLDGVVRLSAGPRENGHRPAADPTFRCLAAYRERAVGVILSGTRDDGTQGIARIRAAGGTGIVQDPGEAAYDGMIRSAIAAAGVDLVMPVREIARHLTHLAQQRYLSMATDDPEDPALARSETRYTCPECGGHIHRETEGQLVRYECEVGHSYSPESLDGEQAVVVESSLWAATRLLGDRAALLLEMADRADAAGHDRTAAGFRRAAAEARAAGEAVRALAEGGRIAAAGGDAGR
jgi:two-component system chemotaxis response regulator CheB